LSAVLESGELRGEAERVAGEWDDVTVEGESVEESGGESFVAEDGLPCTKWEVGGEEEGDALGECGDGLEEEMCACFGERDVAEFVEDDEVGAEEFVEEAVELVGVVGGGEGVDELGDGEEANAVVESAGGETDTDGEMGFSKTGVACEDDRRGRVQKRAVGERENLLFVECGDAVEVKLGDLFEERKTGFFDVAGAPICLTTFLFGGEQGGQIVLVRPACRRGHCGCFSVLVEDGREAQIAQNCV